jgi:Golgi apparatus protein 1
MEEDEAKRSSALKCLQQFRDELHSQECRDQVHRKMTRAARDIRFDDVLANACQEDRKQYCNDVQPVSGEGEGELLAPDVCVWGGGLG